MSFSRRPSCGASTVMKSAFAPRRSASCTSLCVTARSRFTYSWKKNVWPGAPALKISSIEHDASVGTICTTPCRAAARVSVISPSGCPSRPSAVAEMYTGMLLACPSSVVDQSTAVTSRMMRGRNQTRWYAAWFSRCVISSSAAEL
jgi:hypothetical protein